MFIAKIMELLKCKKKVQPIKIQVPLNEEEYYSKLFIKNAFWNKPNPNADELIRWQAIEKFVYYNKGFIKAHEDDKPLNILDVGCGRGWLVNLLSKHGNAQGVEPVRAVAEFGSSLFPGLIINTGTSRDLLLNGNREKFDLIVCSEVIEHVPDQDKSEFVVDLKLLLKKNGFLIISTPRKDVQNEWMKYARPGQPVEDWIDEKSLRLLLVAQGFVFHLIERCLMRPNKDAPELEIYQVWLFQKK